MTNLVLCSASFQDTFDSCRTSYQQIRSQPIGRGGPEVRIGSIKGHVVAWLASFVFIFLALGGTVAAQSPTTFTGTIADEHLNCVQNPMKVPDGVTGKTACVLYWTENVEPKGKYVLYDETTKTTYQLSDQGLVEPYVGAKTVQITGILQCRNKTITDTGIKVP